MARLLSSEWIGGRIERTWSHIGDDGKDKITVEVEQDVVPAMEHAKAMAENIDRNSFLRFKANVTATQLEQACRVACTMWGMSFQDCFREVMQAKTDRAQGVWRTLTEGRDYAKLQASYYK